MPKPSEIEYSKEKMGRSGNFLTDAMMKADAINQTYEKVVRKRLGPNKCYRVVYSNLAALDGEPSKSVLRNWVGSHAVLP